MYQRMDNAEIFDSINYNTVKARIYLQNPVKYQKSKHISMKCAHNRYHSEDEERRNKFRGQRKEWNTNVIRNGKMIWFKKSVGGVNNS